MTNDNEKIKEKEEENAHEYLVQACVELMFLDDHKGFDSEDFKYLMDLRHLIHRPFSHFLKQTKNILDILDKLINKLEAIQALKSHQLACSMRDKIIQFMDSEGNPRP